MDASNYKLIALDLDGTLLNSEKQIAPFTKRVLERLRAKGIQFTIATGRILPAVKLYADELEIDIPLIMSNGSILQTRQGILANQTCLPPDVTRTAIEVSKQEQCDLIFYICDNIYFQKLTDNMRPVYGNSYEGMHEIGSWDIIADKLPEANKGVIIDTTDEANLIRLEPILQQALDGRAATLRTSPVLLEVQPIGVTKAKGLRMLADALGIKMQQIIAFGDYDNDAEMLAAAGLGIAVGDATLACLASADLVVASSDEDGPAHFLEENFLAD